MGVTALLQVENLQTHFFTNAGVVRAVDGVNFTLNKGQILGLVGESGSGKSATALSLMRLIPDPPGQIVGGTVRLGGEDLLQKSAAEMRRVRGERMSMIFQDPMSSLDPVFTIGQQLIEVLRYHRKIRRKDAYEQSVVMLQRVGIPSAAERMHEYPHQFSGGMRQRVMIAMALLCDPDLLIADEPTTALDVTIEAQILDLLREIRHTLGTAIIMITHDLRVVVNLCDLVAVMYAGKVVETGDVGTLFSQPRHPYTIGLLNSIPRAGHRGALTPIPGRPPSLAHLPPGCSFAPRCPQAMARCQQQEPAARQVGAGHVVKCFLVEE
jgi:peptide/nickel transport system ATP-binding protein/oligopeptide transport system ATP-binding protein